MIKAVTQLVAGFKTVILVRMLDDVCTLGVLCPALGVGPAKDDLVPAIMSLIFSGNIFLLSMIRDFMCACAESRRSRMRNITPSASAIRPLSARSELASCWRRSTVGDSAMLLP